MQACLIYVCRHIVRLKTCDDSDCWVLITLITKHSREQYQTLSLTFDIDLCRHDISPVRDLG